VRKQEPTVKAYWHTRSSSDSET